MTDQDASTLMLAAVLQSVNRCVQDRLIALCPDSARRDRLRSSAPGRLDRVLWRELKSCEQALVSANLIPGIPTGHSPYDYWVRRQCTARADAMERRCPELPSMWKAIVLLPRTDFDACCTAIGLDIVVEIVRRASRRTARRHLTRLGADLARTAVDRLDVPVDSDLPKSLIDAWLDAFTHHSCLAGHTLVVRLGCHLVSDTADVATPYSADLEAFAPGRFGIVPRGALAPRGGATAAEQLVRRHVSGLGVPS